MNGALQQGFTVLRAVLPLAGVAMEFCWVYPWILLLTGAFYGLTPTPLLPPGPAFALLALGFITVRAVLARPWSLRAARIGVVAVGLTVGLAAVKLTYYGQHPAWDLRWMLVLLRAAHDALPVVLPEVMGALTAALLWWRGIALGEREFTHFEIDRSFRRGVGWTIVFVLFFVIYGDARGFAAAVSAPGYLLGFFSLGLVMLAVTRLLSIWQESQADETQALAANRHWLLLLVAVVGSILSVATLFSGLVHLQFRPTILRWLAPLEPVVEVVFLIAFSIALVVAKGILYLLSQLPRRFRPFEMPPELGQPLGDLLRDLPPRVVSSARWGMVVVVVAVLLLLIAIAVVRGRRRTKKPDEDERESVWSAPLLLVGLKKAWRKLWARPQMPPAPRETAAVSSIRAIYRELLRFGASLGVPRRPSETPYEYRPRLNEHLPGVATDVAALTEVYVRVRYSPEHPSQEEIERAQASLERIRGSLADS